MKRDYFEGVDVAVELSMVLPEVIPNRVRKPKP